MTKLFVILFAMLLGCDVPKPPMLKGNLTHRIQVNFKHELKPTRETLIFELIRQVRNQEMEMLPFDEPRTEEGQQDGRLRLAWQQAYFKGRHFYEFNGDRYTTMYEKKPHVPQVCADFIVDTIDRTAGTWYAASLRRPRRIIGNYDLRSRVIDSGLDPRRLDELVQYFRQQPDHYQFLFEGLGPKTSQTKKLKTWMKSLDVQIGDIIVIRGRVPWDNGKEDHSHSLFVTGLDEEDAVQLVTGNPTYPVERTLRIEGNRTPRRRVTHIIRLTDEFLMQLSGK